MAKADKVTAVADIAEQFKDATAALVTEYRGLTVANLAELRRSLGDSATYSVAKNTLIKRAATEAGVDGLEELFVGPTAIAFVTGEAVDAAKALKKFAKDHKALVIKGGYMDGRPLTVAEVERIADLESREVLLARLAGLPSPNRRSNPDRLPSPNRLSNPNRLSPKLQPDPTLPNPNRLSPNRLPNNTRNPTSKDIEEGPTPWPRCPLT